MVKGHLYYNANLYRHAVNCYKNVPDNIALKDSLQIRSALLPMEQGPDSHTGNAGFCLPDCWKYLLKAFAAVEGQEFRGY